MKIFVTGDLHIGQSLNYGPVTANGTPEKLIEQEKLLNVFVDEAILQKADLVVFGGDYFPKHFRINPDAVKILSGAVLKLSDVGIPVRMLVGNHDKARNESMDNTVDLFARFRVPGVQIVSKPGVEFFRDEVLLLFVPHLIPAEMYVYQKHEREGVTEIIHHLMEDFSNKVMEVRRDAKRKVPSIMFGHFGVSEAGRGSESTMVASNNICVPVATLDWQTTDLCVLSHIHKFWYQAGKYTSVVCIGSMDRFDFAEANDKKVYGRIEINNIDKSGGITTEIKVKPVATEARKFACVKLSGITDDLDLSPLKEHDVHDAVVKVVVETDSGFTKRKDLMAQITGWLESERAYHTHSIVISSKPVFVSKNSEVTETKTIEENVLETLRTQGFSPDDIKGLMVAHEELKKEVQAQQDKEAEG